jgi:hypothetical protein
MFWQDSRNLSYAQKSIFFLREGPGGQNNFKLQFACLNLLKSLFRISKFLLKFFVSFWFELFLKSKNFSTYTHKILVFKIALVVKLSLCWKILCYGNTNVCYFQHRLLCNDRFYHTKFVFLQYKNFNTGSISTQEKF